MKILFAFAVLIATAASSKASDDAIGRPRPIHPQEVQQIVRPTIWMGGDENVVASARSNSDSGEIARLLTLMKSDDANERCSAAVLWLKQTLGPWPHILAMEQAIQTCSDDEIENIFLVYACGILDWEGLPTEARLTLLQFVLAQIVRQETPPGRFFASADGLLCRFVPDWKSSDARREAAALSLGNTVLNETSQDYRTDVFRQLDAMNPYHRTHRSLESIRDDPLISMPDARRNSEAIQVADAAEYLTRFSLGDIHGAGESAAHFFERKGIGPAEGFKVLKTIINETTGRPEQAFVRENAILALQCTDVPEAFEYAKHLLETETGLMAKAAKFSAERLAEGNTNRLIRLRPLDPKNQMSSPTIEAEP